MLHERSTDDMFVAMREKLRVEIANEPSAKDTKASKQMFGNATLTTLYRLQDKMQCELEILYRGEKVIFLGAKDDKLIAFQLQKSGDRIVLFAGVQAMSGIPWKTVNNEKAIGNWINDSLHQPQILNSTLHKNSHIL